MSTLAALKAELFKALSNPIRIQILNALREKEYSVNQLKDLLGIEAANVSQQLAILRSKKMVKTRKEANSVYYSVQDEAIFSLLDVARTIFNNQFSGMKHCLSDGLKIMIPLVTVTVLDLLSPFYLALEAGLLETELLLF